MNLYLDVDGVISPVTHHEPGDFSDWQDEQFFRYSPQMVALLSSLEVTPHWLTTWREQANTVLTPIFNWEPLDVLERHPELFWWKLESLGRIQRCDEPFIWIDDELDERRADGYADILLERYRAPFLLISPDPHVGLSLRDIDTIEEFIRVNASYQSAGA